MNAADIHMRDFPGELHLLAQTADQPFVRHHGRADGLQRDRDAEDFVECLINIPHAAGTQQSQYGEAPADQLTIMETPSGLA